MNGFTFENQRLPVDGVRGRLVGADLARVIAMMLVVLLHICNAGGLCHATSGCVPKSIVATWLDGVSGAGVNLFGLLSGFLCVKSKWRPLKIVELWLQVVFWGVLLLAFCCVWDGCLPSTKDCYRVICPLLTNQYWYFSSYVILFFLMPVLNQGVVWAVEKDWTRFSCAYLALIVIISGSALVGHVDSFGLNYGFSAMWLVILYIGGAIVRLRGGGGCLR